MEKILKASRSAHNRSVCASGHNGPRPRGLIVPYSLSDTGFCFAKPCPHLAKSSHTPRTTGTFQQVMSQAQMKFTGTILHFFPVPALPLKNTYVAFCFRIDRPAASRCPAPPPLPVYLKRRLAAWCIKLAGNQVSVKAEGNVSIF